MLILAKATMAMMIGFILAIILGLILIPLLRKFHIGQSVSIYLKEQHKKKNGIPTMGGLIFIIPSVLTALLLLITGKIEYSVNLFIMIFVLLSYATIGFLDDFISLKHHENKGLSQLQKLFLQFIVALIFYVLLRHYGGGDSVLRITLFNFEWNLGWFYGVFILFLLVGTSNAVNLTDGLDGLAGGLSAIAFIAFALISLLAGIIK